MLAVFQGKGNIGVGLHTGSRGIEVNLGAGVGMQAHVLTCVADHPHAIGSRVEIDPKTLAPERHGQVTRPHGFELGRRGVQRVKLPLAPQGIQHAFGHPKIHANQLVTRHQPQHGLAAEHTARLPCIEADEHMACRDGEHVLFGKGPLRFGLMRTARRQRNTKQRHRHHGKPAKWMNL